MTKGNKKNIIKNVAVIFIILALIGTVIGLAVTVNRSTAERIGGEVYRIGLIDKDGAVKDGDTAIYTWKAITTSGLSCTLEEGAEIKYQIFFYDKDGKFISSTSELTADYDGAAIPGTAKTCKIMITPTNDEDGKVSIVEVLGYANLLTVTVNR